MVSWIELGLIAGFSCGIVVLLVIILVCYLRARPSKPDPEKAAGKELLKSYTVSTPTPADIRLSRDSLNVVQPRVPSLSRDRTRDKESPTDPDAISIGACSSTSLNSSGFDVPLGTIQPDLYQRGDVILKQESRDSYRGRGRLHLRLKYDFNKSDLVVHLIEAQDLPATDAESGLTDPFIRLCMQPEVDTRTRQSNVKRRTKDPVFDEYHKFPVTHDDLKDRCLILHVCNYDKFSRNEILGQAILNMNDMDVTTSPEIWVEIEKYQQTESPLGELLISLSYLPSAERLTVVIMKAQNLAMHTDTTTTSDPFVRCVLMVEGKKIKKKKTAVRKNTANPVWNEALVFNVPAGMLNKVSLEVAVMDYDLLGHNDVVGQCLIGEGTGSESGVKHWSEIMTDVRKAKAMWHPLRLP